jgi:hypothetical protein
MNSELDSPSLALGGGGLYREPRAQDLRNTNFTPKSTGRTSLQSPDQSRAEKMEAAE